MSDDHEDLADQREHEADGLEREGEIVDEGVADAKKALQATHDDPVIPTPIDEESDGD
ncbi:MAG: hypothetical protein QOF76_3998 [Solirubrobacteraceae bacterium]|jgi:hypothetical protein|nr:hypothetical protein [Solirubrobacteraceae bacterium]